MRTDGQTDIQTETTKLLLALSNYAKATKAWCEGTN